MAILIVGDGAYRRRVAELIGDVQVRHVTHDGLGSVSYEDVDAAIVQGRGVRVPRERHCARGLASRSETIVDYVNHIRIRGGYLPILIMSGQDIALPLSQELGRMGKLYVHMGNVHLPEKDEDTREKLKSLLNSA